MQENRKRYTVENVSNNLFYQMPKFLFDGDFKKLSNDARVLYSLLKDRHSLSLQNNWYNYNGEVYLIYTRKDMEDILGLSAPTIRKAMKKLIELELIEEVRQGLNKPNLIYLLAPNLVTVRSERNLHSGVKKNFSQDDKNFTPNNTNINNTDSSNTNSFIHSSNQEIKPKENEGKNEEIQQLNLNTKTNQSDQQQLDTKIKELDLESSYSDATTIQAIKDSLLTIYTSKELSGHSQSIIHNNFNRINSKVIDQGLWDFNQAAKSTNIKNTNKYLATCIYQAISKVSSNQIYVDTKIEQEFKK